MVSPYPPPNPAEIARWEAAAQAGAPYGPPPSPLDLRIVVAFVALPLIVLLDSTVWFGLSAVLYQFTTDTYEGLGLEREAYHDTRTMMLWVVTGAALLGGVVGLAVGPRVTMAIGLAVCTVGAALLGVLGADLFVVCIVVLALGQGLYRPTVYAAAADALPWPREQLRNVLFVSVYVVLNIGAALSTPLAWRALDLMGFDVLFVVLAAALLLATFLATALAISHRLLRPPASAEEASTAPPNTRLDPRFLGLGLGLILVTVLPWSSFPLMYDLQYRAAAEFAPQLRGTELFQALNPVAVVTVGLLLGLGFVVLHLTRVRLPTLLPAGLGMMVLGLGSGLLVASFHVAEALFLALGIVVLAGGEALMAPLLASRISGDQHWRLVTLVSSLWLAATYLGALLFDAVGSGSNELLQMIGLGLAALCLVTGVILAVVAFPLRRVIEPRDDPPPGTPLPY